MPTTTLDETEELALARVQEQTMDDLTFEILRAAVRVAKDEQIRRLPDLRTRLAQMYPDAERQRNAAIGSWAQCLNAVN